MSFTITNKDIDKLLSIELRFSEPKQIITVIVGINIIVKSIPFGGKK
jgi:hypothetical protein